MRGDLTRHALLPAARLGGNCRAKPSAARRGAFCRYARDAILPLPARQKGDRIALLARTLPPKPASSAFIGPAGRNTCVARRRWPGAARPAQAHYSAGCSPARAGRHHDGARGGQHRSQLAVAQRYRPYFSHRRPSYRCAGGERGCGTQTAGAERRRVKLRVRGHDDAATATPLLSSPTAAALPPHAELTS